jgi:F-box/leucine-rich repeat protein 7
MPLDLVDRIRSFPLFLSAPEDFLNAIVARLKPVVCLAHEQILAEGDEARAMYWLVRGVVAVTSRDGEAVYAELKPGAFFGEIGVLMDIPRTATIIARTKCMLVVLKKEDLQAELPKYPDMEKAIRQEAQERLTILRKKRQESGQATTIPDSNASKATREAGEVNTGESGVIKQGTAIKSKKRKSPSPGVVEDPAISGSVLGSGFVNIRETLKELPLFSTLPADILHFLGLSAEPKSYPPFMDIIRQGSLGNDIYFIVRGEAEVIHETADDKRPRRITRSSYVRPRLKQGQYFGEVSSLGLSEGRTATVRSITAVECLVIGGKALEELWRRCPPEIRLQVEETARIRFQKSDNDVEMVDIDTTPAPRDKVEPFTTTDEAALPRVIFTTPSKPASPTKDESSLHQPSDPDPYLSVDMENLRNRRRSSLAAPAPGFSQQSLLEKNNAVIATNTVNRSAFKPPMSSDSSFSSPSAPASPGLEDPVPKRARTVVHLPSSPAKEARPALPDDILVLVFQYLDMVELIRLRQVCSDWRRLLMESPKLCRHVDLSHLNGKVNDWSVANILAPFIGNRPEVMDISNCFHITDEGFHALWRTCGKNVKTWKMRSVWDVSASQILEMSDNAKELEEIDWSNCRKVGDNLLARVVGWVVPEPPPPRDKAKNVVITSSNARNRHQRGQPLQKAGGGSQKAGKSQALPPPGTVIGCPNLRRLNLSYCKHITDRSMAHLAAHASDRLESLSLTRCTSITDAGFQSWSPFRFGALTQLCLADCTYLSDNSIVALVHAAKNLTHLDLSFCCALSDTATEVVALGLPLLRELRLAFCGSAVSDASLACIALHLHELQGLSVRGCVRVTGVGVETILEGCGRLEWLDVSQCKNLAGWLAAGGVSHWGFEYQYKADEGVGDVARLPNAKNKMAAAGSGTATASANARPPASSLGPTKTQTMGTGPLMKPTVPPRGMLALRGRKPIRFIVQKSMDHLR